MRDTIFLIGGKKHHYKVINNISKYFIIKSVLTDFNDLRYIENSYVFVIGSKIITKEIIDHCQKSNILLLNLHSGDTRKYRGMDCEYWSLFYDNNIIYTMHEIEVTIDTGLIYDQAMVDLKGLKSLDGLKDRIADSYIYLIKKFLIHPYQPKDLNDKGIGKYYKPISSNIIKIINERLNRGGI